MHAGGAQPPQAGSSPRSDAGTRSRTLVRGRAAVLALALALSTVVSSAEPRLRSDIAILYNSKREDIGYNWLAGEGLRRFERQKGVGVRVIAFDADRVPTSAELEAVATQAFAEGVRTLLLFGGTDDDAIRTLARRLPDLRLVLFDRALAASPNVQSVTYRVHEAAYLAGIVAATRSSTGVIGFVGGMDVAGIRAFGCAFAQGAVATRPEVRVLGRTLGNRQDAFNDPAGGRRLADELLDAHADVLFAAAGQSGIGVLAAAAERNAFAIGVDRNQNGLHPGRMLTSVLKRLDASLYTTLVELDMGRWQSGMQSQGLREGAVGLAMDEHNLPLIHRDLLSALETAEFAIRSGEIDVIDAQVDEAPCTTLIAYPSNAR